MDNLRESVRPKEGSLKEATRFREVSAMRFFTVYQYIHIFICRYTLSGLPCRCTFYGNISRSILIVARIVTAYWSCAIWKHIGSMDIYLHIYLCPKYVNARTHTHMHIWEIVINTQPESEPEPEPEPDTKQRQRSASQKPKVHAKYLRNVCFTFK